MPHPHLLTPPQATLRTTIYPPPQSACAQTQNNNVISPLKGTQAPFLHHYLAVQDCVTTFMWLLMILTLRRVNKNQPLITHSSHVDIVVTRYLSVFKCALILRETEK